MEAGQPHNVAIAEARHRGQIVRITGSAATARDDAIQLIVDSMAREGVGGEGVIRLYSERRPSDKWYQYFAAHWPNVAVTWSFAAGEDAKMEASIERVLKSRKKSKKPWWRFW